MSNKANWLVGKMGPRQKAKARARLPQVCAHCGAEQNLTLDHKLARAQGGTNNISNLQMLCSSCNNAKGVVEEQLTAALRAINSSKTEGYQASTVRSHTRFLFTFLVHHTMRQFVPDAESITEFFGEYEARGYRVELISVPRLGGYALRMPLGPGDEVTPLFPLPAAEMQTPEAAQRWMEHLRDHQISQFAFLLERRAA